MAIVLLYEFTHLFQLPSRKGGNVCLIRCAMRLSFLLGEEGWCGLVDGNSGDLDSDLGSESDPLCVLEKVIALCCFLLPLFHTLHLACSDCKL